MAPRRAPRASRPARTQAPSERALELVRGGADEPLLLLHFAFRAITQGPDARLESHGLGRVHHRVLFFVGRDPGLRVADLQAVLGVSKQALNRPLRELVEAKLVESKPAADDARERLLQLTAAGRALESALSGEQRKLFQAAFQRAGAAAVAGWQRVMAELAAV